MLNGTMKLTAISTQGHFNDGGVLSMMTLLGTQGHFSSDLSGGIPENVSIYKAEGVGISKASMNVSIYKAEGVGISKASMNVSDVRCPVVVKIERL